MFAHITLGNVEYLLWWNNNLFKRVEFLVLFFCFCFVFFPFSCLSSWPPKWLKATLRHQIILSTKPDNASGFREASMFYLLFTPRDSLVRDFVLKTTSDFSTDYTCWNPEEGEGRKEIPLSDLSQRRWTSQCLPSQVKLFGRFCLCKEGYRPLRQQCNFLLVVNCLWFGE